MNENNDTLNDIIDNLITEIQVDKTPNELTDEIITDICENLKQKSLPD
jgi:hypothetical protein